MTASIPSHPSATASDEQACGMPSRSARRCGPFGVTTHEREHVEAGIAQRRHVHPAPEAGADHRGTRHFLWVDSALRSPPVAPLSSH